MAAVKPLTQPSLLDPKQRAVTLALVEKAFDAVLEEVARKNGPPDVYDGYGQQLKTCVMLLLEGLSA